MPASSMQFRFGELGSGDLPHNGAPAHNDYHHMSNKTNKHHIGTADRLYFLDNERSVLKPAWDL
jgi:hypothetical protein